MNAKVTVDNPPDGFSKVEWDLIDDDVKRWYCAVLSGSDVYAEYLRKHGWGHALGRNKSVGRLFDDNARRLRQEFRQKQFQLLQMKAEKLGIVNSGERRKLLVTNLSPSSSVLRLYWRVEDGVLGQTTDYFYTDIGRDGGDVEEELRTTIALLELNPIDVIDKRMRK